MIQQYRPEEDDATAKQIASEISANRQRIDAKLAALAESLSPKHLVDRATGRIAGHSPDEVADLANRYYGRVQSFIRSHPLSIGLIALGVTALVFESKRASNHKPTARQPIVREPSEANEI